MPECFHRTMKLVASGARLGLTTGFAMFPAGPLRSRGCDDLAGVLVGLGQAPAKGRRTRLSGPPCAGLWWPAGLGDSDGRGREQGGHVRLAHALEEPLESLAEQVRAGVQP